MPLLVGYLQAFPAFEPLSTLPCILINLGCLVAGQSIAPRSAVSLQSFGNGKRSSTASAGAVLPGRSGVCVGLVVLCVEQCLWVSDQLPMIVDVFIIKAVKATGMWCKTIDLLYAAMGVAISDVVELKKKCMSNLVRDCQLKRPQLRIKN